MNKFVCIVWPIPIVQSNSAKYIATFYVGDYVLINGKTFAIQDQSFHLYKFYDESYLNMFILKHSDVIIHISEKAPRLMMNGIYGNNDY